MKNKISFLILLSICSLFIYKFQHKLIGTKPLKTETEEKKKQLNILLNQRNLLIKQNIDNKDHDNLMDLIDTLNRILKIDPNDTGSMVMLADIAFDKKLFELSAQIYTRYLKLKPKDLNIKAKLASALTFINKLDQALDLTKQILVVDENNFKGLAYQAIIYDQMNLKEEAIKAGDKALLNSPNEEAKNRLKGFLDKVSLKTDPLNQSLKTSKQNTNSVISFFQNHFVIGKKIINIKENDNNLELILENFPIDQMPKSMIQSLKDKVTKINSNKYKQITLVDKASSEKLILF